MDDVSLIRVIQFNKAKHNLCVLNENNKGWGERKRKKKRKKKLAKSAYVSARKLNQMILSPFAFLFAMNKSQVVNRSQIIGNSFVSLHAFVYLAIVTNGTQIQTV